MIKDFEPFVRRFPTKVLSNQPLTETIYDLRLDYPGLSFKPGQFVNLYLNSADKLLPRPISIAGLENNELRLVYMIAGAGTKELTKLKAGDMIELTTPLGNSFALTEYDTVVGVGGGSGVPPIYAGTKVARAAGKSVRVVIGFRSEPILLTDFIAALGAANVYCAVEDEKALSKLRKAYPEVNFTHGNVLTVLKEFKPNGSVSSLIACGPSRMLKAIQDFATPDTFALQFSLEERMGCGFGFCAGCVAPIRNPQTGEIQRLGVCSKGPVFPGERVVFDA